MEAAKEAALDEIPADCGGCCACGTCHVYVNNAWIAKLGEIDYNSTEQSLLEYEKAYKKMQHSRKQKHCRLYMYTAP